MNQAGIQAKVYKGAAKAASFVGATFNQFRPTTANNPVSGAPFSTIMAAFDPDPKFSFKAPSGYSKPIYFGLFDGTNVQVGDYFTHSTQGVFFTAGYEPIKPWLCVNTNRVLTISRPTEPTPSGTYYDGAVRPAATVLLLNWPASVLQGTKGEKSTVNLPGDVRAPWWNCLLPAFAGVQIKAFDIVSDDEGQIYTVSSAELTGLGWRLTLMYSGA